MGSNGKTGTTQSSCIHNEPGYGNMNIKLRNNATGNIQRSVAAKRTKKEKAWERGSIGFFSSPVNYFVIAQYNKSLIKNDTQFE